MAISGRVPLLLLLGVVAVVLRPTQSDGDHASADGSDYTYLIMPVRLPG